ncbi:MAG: radical SAM family heme chaperone HemW [Anaerolineales bacterium]|nr:radical SAM family heme chaperone HemW [Anaerolineales bacterium]
MDTPLSAPGCPPAVAGWVAPPLSLYLHLPFCQVRCAYCDFNTYAGLNDLIPAYAAALEQEIRAVGQAAGAKLPVHTIFFGGGTPSLVPLEHYSALFAALRQSFDLTPGCEITLEANPGTVDAVYLAGLRALGVNRLSFGVQSAHPAELKLLDRLHTFEDVLNAVAWARAAGFDATAYGLNLDLIFGLPHQTLADWQSTLRRVLALRPEHLSLYALSLENGTPLRAWVYQGLLPLPDPDLAADMYHFAAEALAQAGYAQYEISNWARSDGHSPGYFQCRHNLQYWRNWPYLGLGAGAHGCAAGWRYSNVLAPAAYINRLAGGEVRPYPFSAVAVERHAQTHAEAMNETMLLGLRLTAEGVREADFAARYGLNLRAAFGRQLRRLMALGLLAWDSEGARLTPGGRLLGNRAFQEFV